MPSLKEIYTLYYIQEAKKKVTFVPTLIFCAYPKGFLFDQALLKSESVLYKLAKNI